MEEAWSTLSVAGIPLGPPLVALFDALGLFRVFTTPGFILLLTVLVVAIICCTIDRTPRLWHSLHHVVVEQPAGFFDPVLPERSRLVAGPLDPDAIAAAFRARRFAVRRATSPDGSVAWVYGDRYQYLKLATLLTHLGLIAFLAAGAVSAAAGFETVVFVGVGQSAPVRPVGTPGNLLVKVLDFQAPRRADGTFADFRTDLAVYRDGERIARRTIRVNEPLELEGYRFHQNTFGPAADLTIRDAAGALLWTGPVILAGEIAGRPQGFLTIPGTATGLLVVIDRAAEGGTRLVVQGVVDDPATGGTRTLFQGALAPGEEAPPERTGGVAIRFEGTSAWTGMVIRNDPGQPVVWAAFGFLIVGLVLTFYFPRRRVWARVEGGTIALALLGDRHVDLGREHRAVSELLLARGALPAAEPVAASSGDAGAPSGNGSGTSRSRY